nr:MAG TPA: hypothetical protein [Caudoviricetes sp.]
MSKLTRPEFNSQRVYKINTRRSNNGRFSY